MVMHKVHSPKPKMFGKGYGTHLAYNYGLVKMFFKLGFKVLINAIVPGVYYEQAHWGVIDLYHKMSGYRHGTHSDHRCSECGGDLPSSDEAFDLRHAHKKLLVLKEENEELKRHVCAVVITPEVEKRIEEIESGAVEGIDYRDLEDPKNSK
jgi:hypothetical protein